MKSSVRLWLVAVLPVALFGILVVFTLHAWTQTASTKPTQPVAPVKPAEVGQPTKPAKPGKTLPPTNALPGWSSYGGDPSRNMVNTSAKNLPIKWDVEKKENVLWVADLGSRAYGGPIVAGGKVFIGTNNDGPRDPKYVDLVNGKKVPVDLGVLMCFDQATGKFLYQTVFRKLGAGRVADWPGEGLCSSPTVEGDRMYYTSSRCEIVCAKIDTGEFIWKLDMYTDLGVRPHNMSCCCPLLVGDYVYVVTANGVDDSHLNVPAPQAPSFLKIDKKNGKVLWSDNSPTVKLAQINKGGKDVFKTLVNRGELVQHGQWSNPAYAVVNGQAQVIFPGGDGWIRSFDPDGKPLWQFDCNPKDALYELGGKGTRSDFIATPVIYKNRVYIGTGQDPEHEAGVGHLWCIDMVNKGGDVSPDLVTDYSVWPPKTKPNPNSAKVWHYGGLATPQDKAKLGRNYYFGRTMSSCAIKDDLVYVADFSGYLHCLDYKTGQVYWEYDTESETWSAPYWADDKIYFGTEDHNLWVFAHGKEKKLLNKAVLNDAQIRAAPVAVGEVLYVISGNQLFALKNKK